MFKALRRLLIVAAVISAGSVVSLSPPITGPAFAQTNRGQDNNNRGQNNNSRGGRGVTAPLPGGQNNQGRVLSGQNNQGQDNNNRGQDNNNQVQNNNNRGGRGVPAPLLGVGWPAMALAGAAVAGYRLRQRKRSKRMDVAETTLEGN